MAITKTTKLSEILVTPAVDDTAENTTNAKHPTLSVWYFDTFTDSGVQSNPTGREIVLHKFVEDGGAETDISSQDAIVQSIATAVWG